MSNVRLTCKFNSTKQTLQEIVEETIARCKKLGIEEPTNIEITPGMQGIGSTLPDGWDVEIDHYTVTGHPGLLGAPEEAPPPRRISRRSRDTEGDY